MKPVLLLVLLCAPSSADIVRSPGPKTKAVSKPTPEFTAADTDQDGTLDSSEFLKAAEGAALADFKAADRDGDGKVTPAEQAIAKKLEAARRGSLERWFSVLDLDADGYLTKPELAQAKIEAPNDLFGKDGKLSKQGFLRWQRIQP
jgi:Ca2+-binding EF-hand superfamily protein